MATGLEHAESTGTNIAVGKDQTKLFHRIIQFSTKDKVEKRIIEIPKTSLATAKLTQNEWMHIKYGVERLNEVCEPWAATSTSSRC